MKKGKPQYKMRDGTVIPLFEAPYDMSFKVWKTDKNKAIIGDPYECIEAKGLCKMPNAVEAHVGSGRVAYVVFAKTADRPFMHALRFMIKSKSQKVRDAFDLKGSPGTQRLELSAPTPSLTMAHLARANKKLRDRVKDGSHIPVSRGKNQVRRFQRIGVKQRPRARVKAGVVSLEEATA